MAIKRIKERVKGNVTNAMDATDNKLETVESVQSEEEITQQKNELEKQEEKLSLLKNFKPSTCSQNKNSGRKGGLSVVYAPTGKRLSLSSAILKHLPSDLDSIQIGYSDKYLLIGRYLDNLYTSHKLKILGNSKVIYNTSLVEEIKDYYDLNFSNHSSLSFPVSKVEEVAGNKFVFIEMQINSQYEKEGKNNGDLQNSKR